MDIKLIDSGSDITKYSLKWDDVSNNLKVIARVFCKNELWYYLVALSTGESGLIVASDFEIMTTLVGLSLEGKSNLLRINIEEPKDIQINNINVDKNLCIILNRYLNKTIEFKLTDSNKPEAYEIFNTGYIYAKPEESKNLRDKTKAILSYIYKAKFESNINKDKYDELIQKLKSEKYIAVKDRLISDEILFYFGVSTTSSSIRSIKNELIKHEEATIVITKQDMEQLGLDIQPIKTVNTKCRRVMTKKVTRGTIKNGKPVKSTEDFYKIQKMYDIDEFRIFISVDLENKSLISYIKILGVYKLDELKEILKTKAYTKMEILKHLSDITTGSTEDNLFTFKYEYNEDINNFRHSLLSLNTRKSDTSTFGLSDEEYKKLISKLNNSEYIGIVDNVVAGDILFYMSVSSFEKENNLKPNIILLPKDIRALGVDIKCVDVIKADCIRIESQCIPSIKKNGKEVLQLCRKYRITYDNNDYEVDLRINIKDTKLMSTIKLDEIKNSDELISLVGIKTCTKDEMIDTFKNINSQYAHKHIFDYEVREDNGNMHIENYIKLTLELEDRKQERVKQERMNKDNSKQNLMNLFKRN